MSKRYDREDRIAERLKEENRELKQINRSLMKQVKKLSRGYLKFTTAETKAEEQEAVHEAKETAKKICFSCNEGEYKEIIVMNRRWRQCQACNKKGKVTILS